MNNEWENVGPGVKRIIFNPGESIMMMKVHFKKNAEGEIHQHFHEQFTYVLEGKFKFFIDGNEKIVKKGETIFIPSNSEHGVLALEEGILLDAFTPLREDLLK